MAIDREIRRRLQVSFARLEKKGYLPKADPVKLYSSADDLRIEAICENVAPTPEGFLPDRPKTRKQLNVELVKR